MYVKNYHCTAQLSLHKYRKAHLNVSNAAKAYLNWLSTRQRHQNAFLLNDVTTSSA